MSDPANAPASDDLAPVLGLVPSGLFIVTAGDGEGRTTGMLASWVMQAAFEPPALTVAVASKRYLHQWLQSSPQLVVHILGESQKEMLKHFGRGFEPDADAFEGLSVTRAACGLPVLEDCLGFLEGRVTDSVNAGDHVIYVVELTGAGKGRRFAEERPYVHIRKNGLSY